MKHIIQLFSTLLFAVIGSVQALTNVTTTRGGQVILLPTLYLFSLRGHDSDNSGVCYSSFPYLSVSWTGWFSFTFVRNDGGMGNNGLAIFSLVLYASYSELKSNFPTCTPSLFSRHCTLPSYARSFACIFFFLFFSFKPLKWQHFFVFFFFLNNWAGTFI